jgi:hypothetical protein
MSVVSEENCRCGGVHPEAGCDICAQCGAAGAAFRFPYVEGPFCGACAPEQEELNAELADEVNREWAADQAMDAARDRGDR